MHDFIILDLIFKYKILKISEILDETLQKVSVLSEYNTLYYEHQTKATFAIVRKSVATILSTFNFWKTFNKTISLNVCF